MDTNLVKAVVKGAVALVTIFTGKKIYDNAKNDYDRYRNSQNAQSK